LFRKEKQDNSYALSDSAALCLLYLFSAVRRFFASFAFNLCEHRTCLPVGRDAFAVSASNSRKINFYQFISLFNK
jgi:hypothetical protein